MPTVTFERITLAAVRFEAMTDFYNAVFDAHLKPLPRLADEYDAPPLYSGTFAGVPLVLCPNEIAGVQAEQSRHQLHFFVSDFTETLARAQEMGGLVDESVTQEDERVEARTALVRDPDGNTLILTEST